ncbi:ABC-2 type transport system ATP-binding protein [Fulvimarina manganoxydans]|uniref:ABC-2 type transport system ATP-binding protein n=1 Tax=Fulvimarina manganoxydans TaxID=937218 RepID=A0A1W2DS63_9HYPH|nr:ABC transporter ATP-binding protein [Fulvimarina manganoxydans]SMC99836.1 ABC-2 type transport system ATP-binding protein [Fulvimarina manganoxydans]
MSSVQTPPILSIQGVSKTYEGGFQALHTVDLDIKKGEIFALLGPNGAGKTTLISLICGLARLSEGTITVDGHDVVKDYRAARAKIGLVPQELTTDAFETVHNTVSFSRGLFGKPKDPAVVERVLKSLTLWEKRDSQLRQLSGGMKRRVLIAKALAHEPDILFLDEPTAGVDVSLRREMWAVVGDLRKTGVTVILTTHYIEEAEMMADRIGVIAGGKLILVEDKAELMQKLGHKELTLVLQEPLTTIPPALSEFDLALSEDGQSLTYSYDTRAERTGIGSLMRLLAENGVRFKDIATKQSTLEEIFVGLVEETR